MWNGQSPLKLRPDFCSGVARPMYSTRSICRLIASTTSTDGMLPVEASSEDARMAPPPGLNRDPGLRHEVIVNEALATTTPLITTSAVAAPTPGLFTVNVAVWFFASAMFCD